MVNIWLTMAAAWELLERVRDFANLRFGAFSPISNGRRSTEIAAASCATAAAAAAAGKIRLVRGHSWRGTNPAGRLTFFIEGEYLTPSRPSKASEEGQEYSGGLL